MPRHHSTNLLAALAVLTLSLGVAPGAVAESDRNPCNPCAAKAKPRNPCAAKRNPCNPCAAKRNPCNPCAAKRNPCNPCGAGGGVDASRFQQPQGVELARGEHSELASYGEKLWNDRSLGSSGIACATCHTGGTAQMNDSFDLPYPHPVAMPKLQAGVDRVNAAEMVQFCMLVPMADEPLPWQSRELAALTAYVEELQSGFEPGPNRAAANPCNPCAAKGNPCNPCGGR